MKNLIITIIYAFLCFQINCCCIGSRAVDSNFGLNHERISDVQAFEQAVRNHDFYNICLHRSKSSGNPFCQLDRPLIDEIFNDIHAEIFNQRSENPDQYIFVLFSECFFGENEPMNNDDVSYIIEKCRFLSQKKRVMLQVSMLHKFNINDSPYWLEGKYKPVKSRKEIAGRIINTVQNTETSGNTCHMTQKEHAKYFLVADKNHSERVASYTLTIIDGKIVAIYRKSTYYREADKYIHTTYNTAKYAFEFGDFYAHMVEDSSFAKFFVGKNPLVATRMCSDMNAKYLKYNYPAGIVLVHANDRPSIDGEKFHNFIFCVDDTKDLALIFPDNRPSGISGEDIKKTDGCVRCGFDFSILMNSPDEIIPLEHIQYEIN